MIILGIETTCDETGAAVLKLKNNRIQILSRVLASSAPLQAKYGGIIPEQAAREQIKSIIPVIEEALIQSNLMRHPGVATTTIGSIKTDSIASLQNDKAVAPRIDAIAVAYGPGLIGSLLVGVETAKTLAAVWNKPLIPVNHLIGHFYANWIEVESRVKNLESRNKKSRLSTLATNHSPQFPCIGLLVSGGHTDLVLFKSHGKYEYLGGTRDDAAGECFDKCARLLGLPYPGGPQISKLAEKGNPTAFDLPRPMIDSDNFDLSFSGLKTAVARIVHKNKANLAASIESAIVDVLVAKTIRAARKYNVNQIMIAGGVAANKKLVDRLQVTVDSLNIKLHVPLPALCTDNGAMIAAAAFFSKPLKTPIKLQADPNLALAY